MREYERFRPEAQATFFVKKNWSDTVTKAFVTELHDVY